ncbi:MAG: MFS transporter [Candidatus Dormibacteria bacterium]
MSTEPLRRNRNFQLLWVGQSLSALGSNVSDLAYPLLVLALTRSPLKAGLVGTFYLMAQMAFRLPAGAIADRVNRRALMLASDLVRLLALGGLGVAVLLVLPPGGWCWSLLSCRAPRRGSMARPKVPC